MEKIANKLSEERGLQLGNKKSKDLSKEEAIELMRNARKHSLVFSLEACIKPYQNNICACCPDCCIEMNMRYKFGLDVCPAGPYIPSFNHDNCAKCGECASRCPVKAISMIDEMPSVDLKQCLGCGICAEICPANSVFMVLEPSRIIKTNEPGPIKMTMIFFLLLVMFLLFCGYKSSKKSDNAKYFLAKPRASDLIQ